MSSELLNTNVPSLALANGVKIPQVATGCAFGNWTGDTKFQGFLPEQAWRAMTLAVENGIRHFDGAHAYQTERHVGDVLGRFFASGQLKREDVFLTTKLAHPLAPPHVAISARRTWNARELKVPIAQKLTEDLETSLELAGVGYFDLVLMHWPGTFDEKDAVYNRKYRAEVWKTFEHFLSKGVARAIGVCNFTQKHLEELIEDTTVKPHVNQIEVHPYCNDQKLIQFCKDNGILIEAYAPLASGSLGLLQDETIKKIAAETGKGVGQVILRWLVQQGMVVLPRSSKAARIQQNQALFDFELTPEQVAAIDALAGDTPRRTCPDPASIV